MECSQREYELFSYMLTDLDVLHPYQSYDSIWTSWNPYPDCVNAEYEYDLYRESDGQLVRSNVTTDNGFRISGLPCDTKYRLRVRYRTKTVTGTDNWFNVQTNSCK